MKKNRIFLSKGKLMLSQVLLLATLISCQKEAILDPSSGENELFATETTSGTLASSTLSPNVIYREAFEGTTPFSTVHKQFGTSYAFKVATSPVFEGSKSGRFELRDTDPITSGGTRSEVLFPEPANLNQWYSFSVFFPSSGYADDSNNDIINQWHQGESPSLSLRVEDGRFHVKVGNTKDNRRELDLGVQTKDVWHTFVFHVKHSYNSDGLVEVWHNGTKKISYAGGNMYNNGRLPRWKLGIYKDDWNYEETTDTKVRIFYVDDVRVGNSSATVAEMTPAKGVIGGTTGGSTDATSGGSTDATSGGSTDATSGGTTSTTSTQKVVSFTLVNSETEKDVMTITNGAQISLSALGLRKANIRANTQPSTVGSVKFVMSGTQSRTYTDNKFPYALHGDSGTGNYYYGNWAPPALGSYTLKATPYTQSSASGTAGTSYSISFSFVR